MPKTIQQSIRNILEDHHITLPSNRHEDWLYYNLDALLAMDVQQVVSLSPPENNNDQTLYFFNQMPPVVNVDESVSVRQAPLTISPVENPFFVSSHSPVHTIMVNQDAVLNLHYHTTSYSSTVLNIVCNNANLTINRRFLNALSSVQTNTTILTLNGTSCVKMFDENNQNDGVLLDFMDVYVNDSSKFHSLNESYVSNNSRFQSRVFVNGELGDVHLHGVAIHQNNQQTFYNTHVYHQHENTQSRQLFKSLNKQGATFEYNGKVTVKKQAQKINSYQLNQNIILDETANVYSRPQLFIDADDVACSHGSTTGDINQDQLFYLMSRGLDEGRATRMILLSFIQDVLAIHNIPHQKSRDASFVLNQLL